MDTGTARLLHLAEAMDNFKELGKPHGIDKFNIANFFCGSSACALGLAGYLPQFIADGLKMTIRQPTYNGLAYSGPLITDFSFGDEEDDKAIASFFGITKDDVDQLFYPHHINRSGKDPYPLDEHEMAVRLRTFVANESYL